MMATDEKIKMIQSGEDITQEFNQDEFKHICIQFIESTNKDNLCSEGALYTYVGMLRQMIKMQYNMNE